LFPAPRATISSPVPRGGTQIGVTDAGRLPIRLASAGTYAVKVELSGFQTIMREGVVVNVGNTTAIRSR